MEPHSSFFGLDNPAGEEFGYAIIAEETAPVSAPGTVLLVLGAVGWLGARGKRRD